MIDRRKARRGAGRDAEENGATACDLLSDEGAEEETLKLLEFADLSVGMRDEAKVCESAPCWSRTNDLLIKSQWGRWRNGIVCRELWRREKTWCRYWCRGFPRVRTTSQRGRLRIFSSAQATAFSAATTRGLGG